MDDLADRVRLLLLEARQLDEYATEVRAAAGRLLLDAGYDHVQVRNQAPARLGLDSRLVELLMDLAVRQKVAACAASAPPRYPAGPGDRVPH